MSSQHPEEQPETRDELDDVLDNLFADARRNLQSSIERVLDLDLDRGLGAILGTEITTAARPRRTPPSESGTARLVRRMYRWSFLVAIWRHFFGRKEISAPPKVAVRVHFFGRTDIGTPSKAVFRVQFDGKRTSVEGRIENLRRMLGKLSGSKLRAKLHPTIDYGLDDLRKLHAGLAERQLSRTSADQLIGQIDRKLRRTTTPGIGRIILNMLPVPLSVVAIESAVMRLATDGSVSLISWLAGAGLAVFGGLGLLLLDSRLPPWRRRLARRALREVEGLRQAVARLFDESRDGSVHTCPR